MPILGQLNRETSRAVWLDDSAKTKENLVGVQNPNTSTQYVNSTLDDLEVTKGVLAGTAGCVDPTSGYYRQCTLNTDIAIGLFGIDASGEPNEYNAPADHEKITLVSGGFHEIEVYETVSYADNATPLVYAPGDELFVSPFGFLTKEAGLPANDSRPVALIEKAPTADDPKMIIKLYDFSPTGGLGGGPYEPVDPTILRQSDVIDNLTSNSTIYPLSANQGMILAGLISTNRVQSAAILLTPAIIAQGYVDLGATPANREDVMFFIKSGAPQLNYHSPGYNEPTMGLADFAMGDKATNANPSRIYLRSDVGGGGYALNELPDGGTNPGDLPSANSILLVYYQA